MAHGTQAIKTGFRTEHYIFRNIAFKHLYALSNNKKLFQHQMTYLIDILDILKKKSSPQTPDVNLELSSMYHTLFNIKTSPQIEKIRQREISQLGNSDY